MQKISVVIITKNEAGVIGKTLTSLKEITDDIIVADNGSTDETIHIAKAQGARVEAIPWEGYGKTKNAAIRLAKYDWILALDADEAIDNTLKQSILQLNLSDTRILFYFRYKSFMGEKELRFGEWSNLKKIRLFNKNYTRWTNDAVHESIEKPADAKHITLEGYIYHNTFSDISSYADKTKRYAYMMAILYYSKGKKANWFKLYLYPGYCFTLNYFFRLGFLDGRAGFIAAMFSGYYSFLKYHFLKDTYQKVKEI